MSDIVHSHAEHVEKKFCAAIQCHADIAPWWVQWKILPSSPDCNPKEDIYSEEDSDVADHSYLPPKVFALPWHDDVSHIMHMLPCSAYF